MRIGIDCHNLEGHRTGVGRYLWNLLREWSKLTGSDLSQSTFFLYFKNEIPADISGKWNCRLLLGRSNAFFKHWLLPRAAAKDKIDVLFCPDYVLPFFLVSSIKTAVTIHDIIYEARPEEYSWPSRADRILLKWASRQSAKKANIIFVPSEFTKNEILKYYKVNPGKIIVTLLAPDPLFCPLPAEGGERAKQVRHNIAKKYNIICKKYVFFVGFIFNRRFLTQKIRGFAQFAKNHPDFNFLIIGKNHTKPLQNIAQLIEEANQELGRKAIIWREYANDEELVSLYNGAFATLWLSSYEGFGLPVLESMACGSPVITSRCGALEEIGGDAALFIEQAENPEEIARVLDRLAEDEPYYCEIAEKGLSWVKKFSWQKCAQKTLDEIFYI